MGIRYDDALSHVRIYRGKDAVEQFLKSLHQEVLKINAIFANPRPLHMSEKNEKEEFPVCNAMLDLPERIQR